MSALFQALYLAIEAAMLRLWAATKAWSFSKDVSDARYWRKSEDVVANELAPATRLAILEEAEADTDSKITSLSDAVNNSLNSKLGVSSTAANSEQLGGTTLQALMTQIGGQITQATSNVLATAKQAFAQGAKDFGLVVIEEASTVVAMSFADFFTAAFGNITAGSWNDGAYHGQLLLKAQDVDRKLTVTLPNGTTQEMNNLDSLIFTIQGDAIVGVTFLDDPVIELIANNKSEIANERARVDIMVTGFETIISQLNALSFT